MCNFRFSITLKSYGWLVIGNIHTHITPKTLSWSYSSQPMCACDYLAWLVMDKLTWGSQIPPDPMTTTSSWSILYKVTRQGSHKSPTDYRTNSTIAQLSYGVDFLSEFTWVALQKQQGRDQPLNWESLNSWLIQFKGWRIEQVLWAVALGHQSLVNSEETPKNLRLL